MSGQKPQNQRLTEKLCDVSDFQPPHEIESMHLSRADADFQVIRNLSIRQSFRDEPQNFQLSRGEQMFATHPSLLPVGTRPTPLNSMSVQGSTPLWIRLR
jgi:hypothetical protein